MENTMNLNSFKLKVKKGVNKVLTFFGVPANSILIIFGIMLLNLKITNSKKYYQQK